MKIALDMSKVTPVNNMTGDDKEDSDLLKEMYNEAKAYIRGYDWCKEILDSYFGIGIGRVVAVFLFHILPSRESVDDYVWVIVGDIPPLYITIEDAPNPACALDGYIGAMEEWVDAAIHGKTIDGLPPVNVDPTPKNAANLKRRLDYIDKEILSHYQDDLD